MAHKEDTAVKYYRLSEKAQASVKASQTLHTMMRKTCSTACNSFLEASTEHREKAQKALEQIVKEQVDEDFQESENSSSPRSRWSMAQVQEIRKIFREEIQKNEVSVERGRERIMECEILQGIDTRRIYERVRAEWRNPVAAPATLPTEKEELSDRVYRLFREDMPSSSDIVPPTSLSSTTKALFSAELV